MPTRLQLIEHILHSFHAVRRVTKTKAHYLSHQNPVTHSQWFVMTLIHQLKKASIKDIAEHLEMSSSAATQLVDPLVQANLVKRQENPSDRRLVQLELSTKGKKHIISTKHERISEMAEIFNALTDSELEMFVKLFEKMLSNSEKRLSK